MLTLSETKRLDSYYARIENGDVDSVTETEANEFWSLFQKRIDNLDDVFYGARESFDIMIEAVKTVANMKENMGLTDEEGEQVMDTFRSIHIRRCKLRR